MQEMRNAKILWRGRGFYAFLEVGGGNPEQRRPPAKLRPKMD